MTIEIGSFQAKSRLSELLREVQKGARYTITSRGRPVAELSPIAQDQSASAYSAINDMRNFPRIQGISDTVITDFISEGRR